MNEIFKQETFWTVNFYELNKFIEETIDVWVETAYDQSNDTVLKIIVDGDFDQQRLDQYLNDEEHQYDTTENILNYMCHLGHIQQGTYLIKISW